MTSTEPIPTPPTPEYFDYQTIARSAGITPTQLSVIVRIFEADYPHDLMLRELHIFRACRAVQDGRVMITDILREAPPASAA